MKIKLPKEAKGFGCPRLFSFEMNDFSVEALLPALFYLIRSGGRARGKRTDPTQIGPRCDDLARHPCAVGFGDEAGRRVLDRWIRTSLIETAQRGRSWREGEQIFYIKPLSFLSYKPGFPAEARRLRGVTAFIYHILKAQFGGRRGQTAMRGLESFIQTAFGEGLELPDGPDLAGRYDGRTPLDIEVLALLYYLDGFEACPPLQRPQPKPPPPALIRSAHRIADDVAHLIAAYRMRVPSRTLAQFLTGLLNFELFIYTLELIHVVNRLVEEKVVDPWWGPGSGDNLASPLGFYVDLVGDRSHPSARMAQEQVEAHFADVQRFFRNALLLRTLERYVGSSDLGESLAELRGGLYFEELLRRRSDPKVRARADIEREEIEARNRVGEDGELPEHISTLLSTPAEDEVGRVLHLLEQATRSGTVDAILKWYRSVGGLGRADGMLEGNVRGRRVWRLRLSEGLLEILVQLCCVTPEYAEVHLDWRGDLTDVRPRPVSLGSFLRFLEKRYGILIDRPPEWMRNLETVVAAKQNFETLKQRLRQMGLFEDLSDDFNAQYIQPRYVAEREYGAPGPAWRGVHHV